MKKRVILEKIVPIVTLIFILFLGYYLWYISLEVSSRTPIDTIIVD